MPAYTGKPLKGSSVATVFSDPDPSDPMDPFFFDNLDPDLKNTDSDPYLTNQ